MNKHIDKDILARQMSAMCPLTKKNCLISLNAFMKAVKYDVSHLNPVYLYGFASFGYHKWPKRKVKDLKTKKMITVPSVITPTWKPSIVFRKQVRHQ